MSAAAALEQAAPAGDGAAKGGRKKLVILAVPVLLVLVCGGLWFSGVLPRLLGLAHEQPHGAQHENAPPAPVYVELPELVANLNGNPRRPSYIKVKPRLEVAKQEDVARVQSAMPRLLDMFQTFLRETRPEELRGSAGIHRLREELIARANIAVPGGGVTDVLFTEMLIQ